MEWLVVFAAMAVRVLVFQTYSIPSGSMIPTLEPGDTIIASKSAYGYSRFALPDFVRPAKLPTGRFLSFAPRRGDVVIFKSPSDTSIDFVKRIVGLPGERVQLAHGRLLIDGTPAERRPLPRFPMENAFGAPVEVDRYLETLPGGAEHEIIEIAGDDGVLENTGEFVVPPQSYFVLGDNRDNTTDSRTSAENHGIGFVPRDNLVAKVERVLSSTYVDPDEGAPSRFLLPVH